MVDRPRLLVVDDEETICQVFERTLGRKNYEVRTTQDANAALSEMEEKFFNLLIVDLKMPGIDGIQLLRKIKEINPYVEVIIITGYGTPHTAASAIKLGAFDYLTKPFNIIEVEKIIEKCLERQKRAIENIELKELVAFFEISKTITSTWNLDDLLEKIMTAAVQITKARQGSLLLFDEERLGLSLKSLHGISGINKGVKLPLRRDMSEWLAVDGKSLLINKIRDGGWIERMGWLGNELRLLISIPFASAPLMFQGSVLGVINVCQKPSEEDFTERDLTLLNVLASQAAIAIQNAKLYTQLQNKIDELEQTIKMLNQMQAQLIHSEKLASVGRLAAGVVHEICNPLNVISGHTQLLLMDIEKDSPLIKPLRIIEEYVSQISKIANNLLKFAKPGQLQATTLNVNEVLEQTLSLVENRIFLKNIKIENNLSPSLPRVFGDGQQLKQVFLNMILNAEQAMSGGGDLTISTKLTPEENSIEISFKDTGCGIPQQNIDKIFDPFFTTKEGGAGLGLSVSYGIIKVHKGAIDVKSREGEGSTFTIKLPVEQVRDKDKSQAQRPEVASDG